MRVGIQRSFLSGMFLSLAFAASLIAQQSTNPVGGNAGQATQPAGGSTAPDVSVSAQNAKTPAADQKASQGNSPASNSAAQNASEDNPYDPILEPPPLPKGKPTLIGGRATSVDHVRNRLTIQPFGGGAKIKVVVDERSHIYRNGAETTVLGIQKGDRVYVDTMLDGSKILAKNVRVITQSGLAEVRGQVIGTDPDKGTISVRDQLSAKPVSFAVTGSTRYSSKKGPASAGDVQSGSLIEVQFSPRRDGRTVAQEVVVVAKPGDDYIFSGAVTSVDMRNNSFFVDNRSDEQTYEIRMAPGAMKDTHTLKVGAEVTAHATFDGKQYKASNVRVEAAEQDPGEQSKAQ